MKLTPNDFRRSYVGKTHTSLEIGALMRTLMKKFHMKHNETSLPCLITTLE